MRSWWNLSDKKTANVVEKFTSTNVTPALWNSEVRRIQETKASFDNMTVILGRPTCTYQLRISYDTARSYIFNNLLKCHQQF